MSEDHLLSLHLEKKSLSIISLTAPLTFIPSYLMSFLTPVTGHEVIVTGKPSSAIECGEDCLESEGSNL
jgi:hypothetical protein